MKELEQKMEILNSGMDNEMKDLGDDVMEQVSGGVECKKNYTATSCGCNYVGPTLADS
jgi:hypothetical protein